MILVAIDVTRHGMALYRLEHQKVDLARYRVVGRAAESPENLGLLYGSRSRFTAWQQHMIARSDLVIATGKKRWMKPGANGTSVARLPWAPK